MYSPICGPNGTEPKNETATPSLPTWNPGVVHPESMEPFETASKISRLGTRAFGSWNLIWKLPSDISSIASTNRFAEGPRWEIVLP